MCRCGQTNRSVGSGHSRRLTVVEEGRGIARRWVPEEELQAEEEEEGGNGRRLRKNKRREEEENEELEEKKEGEKVVEEEEEEENVVEEERGGGGGGRRHRRRLTHTLTRSRSLSPSPLSLSRPALTQFCLSHSSTSSWPRDSVTAGRGAPWLSGWLSSLPPGLAGTRLALVTEAPDRQCHDRPPAGLSRRTRIKSWRISALCSRGYLKIFCCIFHRRTVRS